jgi:hypothetical protein
LVDTRFLAKVVMFWVMGKMIMLELCVLYLYKQTIRKVGRRINIYLFFGIRRIKLEIGCEKD